MKLGGTVTAPLTVYVLKELRESVVVLKRVCRGAGAMKGGMDRGFTLLWARTKPRWSGTASIETPSEGQTVSGGGRTPKYKPTLPLNRNENRKEGKIRITEGGGFLG